jgi:VTC domain
MDKIECVLSTFDTISLEETKSKAELIARFDEKYIIPARLLEQILNACKPDYDVLEIENKRLLAYETIYFDTPDLYLYDAHHAGYLNRTKIRIRKYLDTGISFLETKARNNKGFTVKSRTMLDQLSDDPLKQLQLSATRKNEKINKADLQASATVLYRRITLVNKILSERVTIDTGIEFIHHDESVKLNDYIIAEIKKERKQHSAFKNSIQQLKIKPGAISKYCLAIIHLHDNIKKNRFKPQLQLLNKKIN